MNDLELLKEYAAGLVARQIRRKEEQNKHPLLAIMSEMQNELNEDFREVLNRLVKEAVLSWHRNINGTLMFEFRRK